MRTTACLSLLVFAFALAACGDSSSDDDKKDDDKKDEGEGLSTPDTDAGMLGDIDDGPTDPCDQNDPCCFGSDTYDYSRCKDGGVGDAGATE